MSRSIRRGAVAAALAVAIAPLATACAAGTGAQSQQVRPNTPATTLGHLKIQNIALVTSPKPGDSAVNLTAAIINQGAKPATLTSVSVAGGGTVQRQVTIPANSSVLLGGKGQPSIELPTTQSVKAGGHNKVTFSFAGGGSTTVQTLAVIGRGHWAGVAPSAPATAGV